MPTLQVKVEEGLLQVLRDKAKAAGCTQAEYVTAWLEGLAAGEEGPEIAAEVSAVTAGSSAVPAGGAATASTPPAAVGDGEVLAELRKQTVLLERLVGAGAVPAVTATAMPVVLSYDPLLGSEVAGASPADVDTAVTTPAPAAEAEPEPDVLAAERARQQQELKAWQAEQGAAVAAANEIERRSAFAAAGHAVADAAPAAVEEKKGSSDFAERLKAAAAEAAAQAEADTPAGGSEVGVGERAVTADATPEEAVITPADDSAQVVEVEAMQADPADDDLLKRVEELEAQDRLMENWLAGIQGGGEPIAPPLPADASEADWQAAAEAAVIARGKKPLPELVEAALKYWGRE